MLTLRLLVLLVAGFSFSDAQIDLWVGATVFAISLSWFLITPFMLALDTAFTVAAKVWFIHRVAAVFNSSAAARAQSARKPGKLAPPSKASAGKAKTTAAVASSVVAGATPSVPTSPPGASTAIRQKRRPGRPGQR